MVTALALYKALVELLPISRGHIVKTLSLSCSHGRLHCNVCNAIKCSDLRRIDICPCVRLPVLKIQCSGISFMNVSWVRLRDNANQLFLSPCSGLAPHTALGVALRLSRRLVCCMGSVLTSHLRATYGAAVNECVGMACLTRTSYKPGFVNLQIRDSQPCTPKIRPEGVNVATLFKR